MNLKPMILRRGGPGSHDLLEYKPAAHKKREQTNKRNSHMSPYRIAVNAHALFSDGLREIVQKIPDVEVVGSVGSSNELLHLLNQLGPNLIIFDIHPPIMDGLIGMQQIKKKDPQIKTLALSAYRDTANLLQAFKYGADGYLLKNDPPSELFKAIETIRNERTYISPFFSNEMFGHWGGEASEDFVWQASSPAKQTPKARPLLSARRQEVLELIAEGRTSNEIASFLGISPRTVEHHRESIKKKLKLCSTADLIRYALTKEFL